MNDALSVRVVEGLSDLVDHVEHLGPLEGVGSDELAQAVAFHELHDEKRAPVVGLADVVDLGDRRMLQGGRRPRLAHQAGPRLTVAQALGGERLQRDEALKLLVTGTIDDPHSARPEAADNAVAIGDALSRLQRHLRRLTQLASRHGEVLPDPGSWRDDVGGQETELHVVAVPVPGGEADARNSAARRGCPARDRARAPPRSHPASRPSAQYTGASSRTWAIGASADSTASPISALVTASVVVARPQIVAHVGRTSTS